MASITYTAKRELKTGHVEGDDYILDFDAQQIDENNTPQVVQHVAKSGRRETVFTRYDKGWHVESDQIEQSVSTALYGTAYSITGAGDPAMAPLSSTELAYFDHTLALLRLLRFNSQSLVWTPVGAGLSIPGTSSPAMCDLTSTDIVMVDATNNILQAYRVNLTTGAWSTLGNPFDLTTLGADVGAPALAQMSDTRVAFFDTTNEKLTALDFDGTDWTITGATLSIAGTGTPALAGLNDSEVAFVDTTLDSLRRYRFSGTAWSLVGSGLSVSGIGGAVALGALNDLLVVLMDATVETLRVYLFDLDSSTWSLVDSSFNVTITGAGNPALAAMSDQDVAFFDSLLEQLLIYRIPIFTGDQDSWDEFAASVAGGELFTLDPYGTSDDPDNPVTVKLTGGSGVRKMRVNQTRRMVYSFDAIEQE